MSQDSVVISSDCGSYRYTETISLAGGGRGSCVVIGLCPQTSEAQGSKKYREICIEYATRNQFDALVFVNLYAKVDLLPQELIIGADPVGQENDDWLSKACEGADLIIGAWGDFSRTKKRIYSVLRLLDAFDIYAIQTNRNGTPSHPLAWKMKAAKLYRRGRSDKLAV